MELFKGDFALMLDNEGMKNLPHDQGLVHLIVICTLLLAEVTIRKQERQPI